MQTLIPPSADALDRLTSDGLEQELAGFETLIARARACQVRLLREADRRQIPKADGCSSLKEWTAGRLDVHPGTAGDLAHLAKTDVGLVDEMTTDPTMTFDRAAATVRLVNAGADGATVGRSRGVDVQHVRRLVGAHQTNTRRDEAQAFADRHLYAQFSLDFTWVQLRGGLPAVDGERLLAGLDERADRLVRANDEQRPTLAQRRADALVTWAMDELDTDTSGDETGRSHRMHGAVLIDGALAARTCGEAGATTRNGLKVGPNTLDEILCSGTIDVTIFHGSELKPVGRAATDIPPRTRRFVLHRDGGCTADGCTSRYRLEPHHVRHRSHDGGHDPANLTTLCWFHHHVVVHQRGFSIDPASPPGRRRFVRPDRAPPG